MMWRRPHSAVRAGVASWSPMESSGYMASIRSGERLRRHVDAGTRPACALSLDGLMLNVLVAKGLDEKRVTELAAFDDRCPKCNGQFRVFGVVTEPSIVRLVIEPGSVGARTRPDRAPRSRLRIAQRLV